MDVVALRRVMIRLFWCMSLYLSMHCKVWPMVPFLGDEFRRLATEAGLPFLAGKVKLFSVSKSDKGNKLQIKKVEVCM